MNFSLRLQISRMMLENRLAQRSRVDVRVDFGRADAFVAEQSLNDAQVCTAFEQGCGEGMAQRVGRNHFFDAGDFGLSAQHDENHHASQMGTATIQKNEIFLAGLDCHAISVVEPEIQLADGAPGNRHEPLLRPFAENANIAVVEEQVRQFQRDEFADAQAARKQHFDDGAVAVSLPFRQVDARLDLVDFRRREHFRQVFAQVRRFQEFRRVVFDEAVEQQKAVERADAAQDPRLRRRSDAHFVERGSEVLQVVQLDAKQVLSLAPAVVLQVQKVVLIRLERVRRVVALQFQVAHVLLDDIFFRFLVLFHENRG